MRQTASRIVLGVTAALLVAGGAIHASAFGKAVVAVGRSDLPPFYGNSLKALWLGDSATLIVLGLIMAWIALRPVRPENSLLVLLALLPASTAALLYVFLGAFFAGHLLLLCAGLIFIAAMLSPRLSKGEQS